MSIDKIALIPVVLLGSLWSLLILTSAISFWPFGLLVLLVFSLFGYVLFRVLLDRLRNEEDDHYENNVKQ